MTLAISGTTGITFNDTSTEFAPPDIKATIPSESAAAEAARQVIRDKYATMQAAIDAASTIGEIKAVMPQGE
jgi:hypothetical protein